MFEESSHKEAGKRKPTFTHPPEWTDEERMHFLLAPFPVAASISSGAGNPPTSRDNPKMRFWSSLVISSCRELREPVFTERALMERFKWKGTSPSCLPTVLQVMEKEASIKKLSEFEVAQSSDWVRWGLGVMSKPLTWAWRSYFSAQKYEGVYVITSLVKVLADAVMAEQWKDVQYKSTDRVMKYSDFQQLCHRLATPESTGVLECYLQSQRLIARERSKSGLEVVKFASREEKTVHSVSNMDIGIVCIKDTVKSLSEQVASLQQERERLMQTVREKLRLKNRQAALYCLRRAKRAEANLTKREGALDNVQTLLTQIQMAETDTMVLKALRSGTQALKFLHKSEGLTVENVESVMEELQEVLQEGQEVTDILSRGVAPEEGFEGGVTEEELERELALLVESQVSHIAAGGITEDELEREFAALDISTVSHAVHREKAKENTSAKFVANQDLGPGSLPSAPSGPRQQERRAPLPA